MAQTGLRCSPKFFHIYYLEIYYGYCYSGAG